MKFTITKEDLQRELAFVQSVVERRNMIPVLANVLIESVSADSIRINGTDLDVTIRADVQVETMPTQGAICVQARKLFDIVRLLSNGPVTFTKEENEWVTVKSDKSTFRLPGIARETFPDLPTFQARRPVHTLRSKVRDHQRGHQSHYYRWAPAGFDRNQERYSISHRRSA